MNQYIKSDLYRYRGNTSCISFIKEFLHHRAFRYMVAHRLLNSTGIEKWGGVILWLFINKDYIQIPTETKIGYGLYIGHGGPIIINGTAVIGDNCNLSQFLTIGANEGKAAIIGDNVYVGPNVCIVENVKIGDNVTIGAGSVVCKDIPCNATAVGNYAKVVNYDHPARYIGNMWKNKMTFNKDLE